MILITQPVKCLVDNLVDSFLLLGIKEAGRDLLIVELFSSLLLRHVWGQLRDHLQFACLRHLLEHVLLARPIVRYLLEIDIRETAERV